MLLQVEPNDIISLNDFLKVSSDDYELCAKHPKLQNNYAFKILATRKMLGLPMDEKSCVESET